MIAILHLSDLHFEEGSTFAAPLLRADAIVAAFANVDPLRKGLPEVCILLVSGDLAGKGRATDYAVVLSFVQRCRELLRERLGCEVHVVSVPGNHDCEFQVPDDVARDTLVRNVDPATANDSYVAQCSAVQANYRRFALDVGSPPATGNALVRIVELPLSNGAVRLQLVNSAWMSTIKEKQGQLVIPLSLLSGFMDSDSAASNVAITAFHHPYNWFESNNARAFRKMVERSSDVVFTGHEHEASGSSRISPETTVEYVEGGVLFYHKEPDHSSFNAVVVNPRAKTFWTGSVAWEPREKLYLVSGQPHAVPFLRNQSLLRSEFELSASAMDWLRDPGATYSHPRKEMLELSDVFVYPDLREVEIDSGAREQKVVSDVRAVVVARKQVIISGGDGLGKTALAQTLFEDLRQIGIVPIYVDGSDLPPGNFDLDLLETESFREQYNASASPATLERYRQLDKSRRAIVVDNVHSIKVNVADLNDVVSKMQMRFATVVLLSSHDFTLLEAAEADLPPTAALWTMPRYQILETGYVKRHEMIVRWARLGATAMETDQELWSRVDRLEKVANQAIETAQLPATPGTILLILHFVDGGSAGQLGKTSTALYESMVTQVLHRALGSPESVSGMYTYLSDLAFSLYKRGVSDMSRAEFDAWHAAHLSLYALPFVEPHRQLRLLTDTRLLREMSGRVLFRYRYAFNFFVARYLRDHLTDSDVPTEIERLCARLHRDSASGIVLFLCSMTQSPIVLDRVVAAANALFAERPELDVFYGGSLVQGAQSMLPQLSLDEASVEERRRRENERRDGKRQSSTASRLSDDELDRLAEQDDSLREILSFAAAQRGVEILGQIVRVTPGSFRRERKLEIVSAAYSLGLRALSGIFARFAQHLDHIAVALTESVLKDEVTRLTPAQLRERILAMIFLASVQTTTSSIRHIASSFGTDQLSITLADVVAAKDGSSYRAIDLAAKLEMFRTFPEDELEALWAKVDGKSVFGESLVRQLVWHHLHLFPVEFKTLQRVCARVGIRQSSPALRERRHKRLRE